MTLVQMKDVIPYTNYTSALEALDNGGRFYNLFAKADDEEISLVELAKVAGVFSDKQKMFLFYEMAVQDLTASDQQSLFTNLSENLQASYNEHRPQVLLPSEADSKGVSSQSAILTGIPRFVTDKTVFNGFIFIPMSTGKSTTMVMVPIMDQYDIYELTDESSSTTTFLANVRGTARLPVERARFGGILKETSIDNHGKNKDRLFLEAHYYTKL